MTYTIKRFVFFSLLALITGCAFANSPEVRPRYLGAYAVSHRDYLIAEGARVEVIGNPFSAPKPDVDLLVTNVLRTSHFGGRFKLSEDVIVGTPYRIVVAFNADLILGNHSLCDQEPAASGASADGRVHVQAAFCSKKRLLSSTQGHVRANRLVDTSFRQLISQVGFELFPPVDDRTGDQGSDFL